MRLLTYKLKLVRLLAWIIVAGDTEVFTERGATLYVRYNMEVFYFSSEATLKV